jgi:RNA-binding protein YlmH
MNFDNPEDNLLRDRFRELSARAVERSTVEFTRFLDPSEQTMAMDASKKEGAVSVLSGPEGMERRVCAFDGRLWLDDDERRFDWPVLSLEILWDGRFAHLAHRDILGALLSLGMGRESLGDIQVGDDRAVVWALEGIVPYVLANLATAGRAAVKVRVLEGGESGVSGAQTRQVRGSVHSLRLDAVVAEAFDLSREEAARAITGGLVKLDYAEADKTDRKVQEGALISVRGMGRARLTRASEHTKRSGRTIVEFDRTV